MTLLTTTQIPDHSPWHIASGIVVTLTAAFALMVAACYFIH